MGSGMFLYPEGPLQTASPYALAYRRDKGTMRIEIVSATFSVGTTQLNSVSQLMVRLTHTKTKKGRAKRTSVETQSVGSEVFDVDGNIGGEAHHRKFEWCQKFQLVSEKLSLGDQLHEQLTFEVQLEQGFVNDVVGQTSTTVNGLFVARRGTDATASSVPKHTFDRMLLKRVPTAKNLDVRDRKKSMVPFSQCFIAGEGVEWLSHWLRENGSDASTGNRLFIELLNANVFEVLEQDGTTGKPREMDSYSDAFLYCRFL